MLTLEQTKAHLRVDHDAEDTLISSIMAAATDTVAHHIGVASLDDTAPASVKLAALLMVGSLYENREGGARATSSGMFERLLEPYRVLV